MLAALILAGVCLSPPLFDGSGPPCTTDRQLVECGCSECFSWDPVLADPVAGTPAADWYVVYRFDPTGAVQLVGTTRTRNRPAWVDDSGNPHPVVRITQWCPAWDSSFPHEGVTYTYQLSACVVGARCSATGPAFVSYVGAPYRCFAGGLETPCYPGAPLLRP
jgi:hypothetical protein